MLRLPKKFSREPEARPRPVDASRLLAEQALVRGVSASLAAAVASMALWVWSGLLFDRYFPWASMLQGMVIGLVMRRWGRGIDWRFPLAAALIAALAAALGSFLNALFLTGREFGTGALELVDEISLHTLKTFFGREFGVVGLIYMGFGAALAAFYSNRRLSRREAIALRRQRDA